MTFFTCGIVEILKNEITKDNIFIFVFDQRTIKYVFYVIVSGYHLLKIMVIKNFILSRIYTMSTGVKKRTKDFFEGRGIQYNLYITELILYSCQDINQSDC